MIQLIRSRRARLVAVSVMLAACGGRDPVSVRPAHVEIIPGSPAVHVGETVRLRARVTTSDGRTLAGRSVTWESLDPAIATIEQNGDLLGVGVGVATIRATSDAATATAEITVTPGPSIQLTATQIELTAAENSTTSEEQTIEVTNGGGGRLGGLGVGVTYADGEGGDWLSVALSDTAAPAEVVLAADPGSLAEGTYDATVHVSSPHADNSPVPLAVRFVVTEARPAIGLGETRVSFATPQGGSDPAPTTIPVTNSGGGTLSGLTTSITYADRQPTGWLTASIDDTAPASLTLDAEVGSLVAGVYTATVRVSSPLAQNSPQAVTVTFSVGAPVAVIALDHDSLTFTATRDGADPAVQRVAVTNAGTIPLTGLTTSVTYHDDEDGWLTRGLSATTAPATLSIAALIDSLDAGTYTATLEVASTAATNSPQPIEITLVVEEPPPTIAVSAGVVFLTTVRDAPPNPVELNVTNAGGGTITGLTTAVTYDAGQPTGWLTPALGSTTAPTVLRLNAVSDGLAPGNYTARVRVTADNASNSPEIVVTLSIAETVPTPPSIVTASVISHQEIQLTWSGATGAINEYRIERRTGTGPFAQIGIASGSTSTVYDTGLAPATSYTYRVRACNTAGCSGYSAETSVTTLSAP